MEMSVIEEALKKPFGDEKTRIIGGGLIAKYIDARQVMDRLDEVVGPLNWSDNYMRVGGDNEKIIAVECTLTLYPNSTEPIVRRDVGSSLNNNGQVMNDTDPFKAAYSDALKRAAVKVGIGRYLYSDEDIDEQRTNHSYDDRPWVAQNWTPDQDWPTTSYEGQEYTNPNCEACGTTPEVPMVLKFRNDGNQPFWSCVDWFNTKHRGKDFDRSEGKPSGNTNILNRENDGSTANLEPENDDRIEGVI